MEIGEPVRRVTVTPVKHPIPGQEPNPRAPQQDPTYEPVEPSVPAREPEKVV